MDLKIKEDKIKKDKEAYVLAIQNMEASKERVLEKTKEIYVYTNDTASLKLTISANADFSDLEFNKKYTYMYKRKSDYINKFLNNKSYGYKGVIGNGRKQFSQLWLHDSVIPAGYAKKFRVVRYYRMNAKERVYNIERDKKRAYYHREPRGDSVFAINRGIVDFNDLKNQKLKTEIRSFFIPRNIDLNRKENYFYFTSLNANVSKEEFLKAVSYFKTMFIKTKNPDTYCQIKKVKVTKE